jgi:N-acetylglucosamine-6-phosphate deacetylase
VSALAIRGGSTPADELIDVVLDGERVARPGLAAERVLDATGLIVAPGFIDLQVNGAAGHDITSDPASVWAVGGALAAYGVAAFLPTVVTSPPTTIKAASEVLRKGPPKVYRGARALGLHLEGPFLNPERRGVHDPELLRAPDRVLASTWSTERHVRLVTLAPELPGALDVVRSLVDRGIVVSAGHSAATVDEARAGIDAGIRYATHLWNAMPPLEHRAPGLVAALLDDDRVTVGVIADGVHLHPATLDLTWRAAGARRVSLVTDAVSALGLAAGVNRIGDAVITVEANGARSGGRLAGGLVGLDAIVRNLVAFTGATPAEAIDTVTTIPAAVLGLADRHTPPQPGDAADLTILTPALDVVATIVGGQVVHADPAHVSWLAQPAATR